MVTTPRVSIGMPVYNGQQFIQEAVQSLLEQTSSDFELLISDNASTDATKEICLELAKIDSRIQYFQNERNLGAAPNYNRLFALSRGEYFKWAAHDDICAPKFIESCIQILDAEPSVVLVHPSTIIIDENGEPLEECTERFHLLSPRPSERLRSYFLAGAWVFHPIFGVIRSKTLQATPLIEDYDGSDLVLLARLALAGKCYQLPERLFLRREHAQRSGNIPRGQVHRWWNTNNDRNFLYFTRWRRLREYLRTITQAEISTREQAMCLLHVLRWCRWFWPNLYQDIVDAAAQLRSASHLRQKY